MKIIVYAICKNESKFVNRWYQSMKEADEIYVLDTGSTDNTKELLEKLGVKVQQSIIDPFRFDVARNLSLDLVPNDADLCVCTDLDEVFEPGWRDKLEKNYQEKTRIYYTYHWQLNKNDKPTISFMLNKIHTRKDYKWTHPVHEVLTNINNNETIQEIPDIILKHYPDNTKNRSNYLNLLELSVKEDPEDDRNVHYLGREYMYYNKYQKAIDTLIKHLTLKNSKWKDERCASMRFIGRCYKLIKRYNESIMWYEKAIKEAPHLRDPYVELGILYYELNNFSKSYYYLKQAIKITTHQKTYINEIFSWNETPYDILSIDCYNLNLIPEALYYIDEALKINPDNDRILKNKKLMEKILKGLNEIN